MSNEELDQELNKLFLDHPDGEAAKVFLTSYGTYAHMVDDVIDEKEYQNHKRLLPTYMMHLNLLSCKFYLRNRDTLYPVMRVIHHSWFDSIEMERSENAWQRVQAETLKGAGIEMTLTIIEILGGYECRRRLSIAVREHAYKEQHKNENPEV